MDRFLRPSETNYEINVIYKTVHIRSTNNEKKTWKCSSDDENPSSSCFLLDVFVYFQVSVQFQALRSLALHSCAGLVFI